MNPRSVIFYFAHINKIEDSGYLVFSDLNDKLDIINLLIDEDNYSDSVRKMYNDQIVMDLYMLRAIQPVIVDYSAVPIEGFCKLVKYSEQYDIFTSNTHEMYKLAFEYVEANKTDVMVELEKGQKIMGGKGCKFIGENRVYRDKEKSKRINEKLKNDEKVSVF